MTPVLTKRIRELMVGEKFLYMGTALRVKEIKDGRVYYGLAKYGCFVGSFGRLSQAKVEIIN